MSDKSKETGPAVPSAVVHRKPNGDITVALGIPAMGKLLKTSMRYFLVSGEKPNLPPMQCAYLTASLLNEHTKTDFASAFLVRDGSYSRIITDRDDFVNWGFDIPLPLVRRTLLRGIDMLTRKDPHVIDEADLLYEYRGPQTPDGSKSISQAIFNLGHRQYLQNAGVSSALSDPFSTQTDVFFRFMLENIHPASFSIN